MSNILLILGAGSHGRIVADCALSSGIWDKIVFLDDRYPSIETIDGWPVIGTIKQRNVFSQQYPSMAVGLGVGFENLRVELIEEGLSRGVLFPAIIHPSAVVAKTVTIGDGSLVCAGSVLNLSTKVGKGCIINTHSCVEHDCIIEDGSHISPSATLAGGVVVGAFSWIGMGSLVIQNIHIGQDVTVAAGAVVIRNIPNHSIAMGVPAVVSLKL